MQRIVFLSFVGAEYSRSAVLLNYESKETEKSFYQLSKGFFIAAKELKAINDSLSGCITYVVMSPCHLLVLPLRLLTKRKIILDAGWPLTDGILSRGLVRSGFYKLVKNFILDLISFHLADLVLLETNAQIRRVKRMFGLSSKKMYRNFTGLNENFFKLASNLSQEFLELESRLSRQKKPLRILFRGKINKESGIETIIEAARILEEEASFVLVTGKKSKLEKLPNNCFVISDLNENEMCKIYEICDLALGQISNHNRLQYTIPHKAFEAGFFGKCYISPYGNGISELYSKSAIHTIEDISSKSLAKQIRNLKLSSTRQVFENQIRHEYFENCSQQKINANFNIILNNFN